MPIRPSGPTSTAALRTRRRRARAGRRRRGRPSRAQARAERLGRRARDLLRKGPRLLGALEHVAPGWRTPAARATRRPAAAASSSRARQTPRLRSFSPSAGSICATATRTCRLYYRCRRDDEACASTTTSSARTRTWSRTPSRRPRMRAPSRWSGCRSSSGPRRGRCSSRAATISASTGRATCTGGRSELGIEIHLPRYQPRSTLPLAACLWAGTQGRLRHFKHALYEAFFCEGEDIATDARDRPRGRARRTRPGRRGRAPPTRRSASLAFARSGPRPRRQACAACRRCSPRTGETHWGMGGLERLAAGAAARPSHRLKRSQGSMISTCDWAGAP